MHNSYSKLDINKIAVQTTGAIFSLSHVSKTSAERKKRTTETIQFTKERAQTRRIRGDYVL
jgi:hypothetical protein